MSTSTSASLADPKVQPAARVDPVLANAPLKIGRVALTVRDLASMSRFYQQALGLKLIEQDRRSALFGTEAAALLELRHDPDARARSPREAGLFHTAFLLPERADLGAWVAYAAQQRLRLLGASDHLVSEAVYLTDPEGNGIEIYTDRPSADWPRSDGMIDMPSERLDLRDVVDAGAGRTWFGFPSGGVVGHVHLQVGEIKAAESFYADLLGLDITCRYPGGSFYGSGGYHHQLATNVWNSQGAPVRSDGATGLADVEILAEPSVLEAVRSRLPALSPAARNSASMSLRDPWGTSITLRAP
ncbi:MAG TPA: VOC family protein [Allosphingosinicella sp.]|jgi:catechol 2,3-dioxygenase|uniref:VOC family protein n=1 Tax=Allosphingosinicella sp. TaxID=2823234 RepID=UPI002F29DF87